MRATAIGLFVLAACQSTPDAQPRVTPAPPSASAALGPEPAAEPVPAPVAYAWRPTSTDPLAARFVAPPGFRRVPTASGSFAAYLRTLPVAPAGTPVRSYRGDTILDANDPRLAAVIDIDIGRADLQQCADTVIRMHAEWRRHSGRGDVSYKASSGFVMSYARYRAGERFHLRGNDLAWSSGAAADDSRTTFRTYLDEVFAYANTVSIARDAKAAPRADVQPGDFFVLPGGPGHAVLILDIAVDSTGRKRALIAQGYMPAQSVHVLRDASTNSPWYSLEGETLVTPFWAPFPWSSLRRFD